MSQEDYEKQQEMEKLLENDRNQRINQVEQLQNQNILEQERLNKENLRHQEELIREQNTIQFEKDMDDRIFQLRMTLAQTSDTLSRNDLQALLNEEEAKRDRYYAEKEAAELAEQQKVAKQEEIAGKLVKSKGKKSKKNKKGDTNTVATIILGILTLVAVIILVAVYRNYQQKYKDDSSLASRSSTVYKSSVGSDTNKQSSNVKTSTATKSKQVSKSSSQKVASKSSSKTKNSISASSSQKVRSSSRSYPSKSSVGFKIKDYTGQNFQTAVKDLVKNYGVVESQIEVEEVTTSDYDDGVIISQTPSYGEFFEINGDNKIILKVAVEKIETMPNLTGSTYSEAIDTLTELGVLSSHITVYQADPNSSTGYTQVTSPSSSAKVIAQTPYYGDSLSENVVLYLAADEEKD